MNKIGSVFCLAALGALSVFADAYDERLEYIETDGTQWADTGVKLHCRNSKFQVRIRVLDYATTSQVLFGGMTGLKDVGRGNWDAFGIGTKPTGNVATDKSLVSWNEGSDSNGYFWPTTGKFPLTVETCRSGEGSSEWSCNFNMTQEGRQT